MPSEDAFRPVGRATTLVEATGGALAAVAFGLASALRRARVFHPDGIAFDAVLVVQGSDLGVPLLDVPGRLPAIVRLSRGIGLAEPRADILGLAVRIVDAHGRSRHQDLLLVTSGERPGLRHALVPSRTYDHPRWSSLLPYRLGDELVVFGARPLRSSGARTERLADLAGELSSGRLRYALEVATTTGPWRQVGVLEVGDALPEPEAAAVAFNPASAGGGIRPVGLLQALRRLAYRGSQAGRRATERPRGLRATSGGGGAAPGTAGR